MRINTSRFKLAFKAMTIHFGLSLLVAAVVALLVFTLWFPYPYRELAGGRELFILVMAVDIVCGPLLTFVLFSPTKPKKELITDISLIAVIQILALCYGIWTVWQVRPLFVVQHADKLSIISRSNVNTDEIKRLPDELKPTIFSGPIPTSLRELTKDEVTRVVAEIQAGGHDALEQPSLYVSYNGEQAYFRANLLKNLLVAQPELKVQVDRIISKAKLENPAELRYLYIVGRQYWIAIINSKGETVDYISTDQ